MAAPTGLEPVPGVCLEYRISGPLDDLVLPEPALPGPADDLWQHTCLEAFASTPGGTAYREFNFSPSGQWAAYRFHAERQREVLPDEPEETPPGIQLRCDRDASVVRLRACIRAERLPVPDADDHLLWGLTAVLEHRDGRLSYWALAHPRPQPDFHHPDGRNLALPLQRLGPSP